MTRHGRPVVRCDKLTMEVVDRYPSTTVAAISTGKRVNSIESACEGNQVSSGRYVWRYFDKYDPDETFEGKANRPVYVFDTVTKAVAAFDTLSAAARRTGLRYAVLSSSINRRWHAGGRFVVKYAR